jgi:hypothetical protein
MRKRTFKEQCKIPTERLERAKPGTIVVKERHGQKTLGSGRRYLQVNAIQLTLNWPSLSQLI